MPSNPYAWIDNSLETIHRADWYRSVKPVQGLSGAVITLAGQQVINFASNDYLGLAGDERLMQAAIAAVREYGTGSTGSRLLSGHRELHRELEQAIAQLKQTEDALVFSSGYLANLGTISALVGKRDLILADQYNHSSLKNGAILSGATVVEYPHCDLVSLGRSLEQDRTQYRRCLILTDSVFSMDGDLCPLPGLLDLAEEFNCMTLVDEAHATGVMGKTGAGCVEHFACTGRPVIQMGTLSKALGSLGGYVAGAAPVIDYLRNRASSWIYTTGLSPADTAAALEAIRIIQQEPQRLTQLRQNAHLLTQSLLPFSPITPITPTLPPSPILCLPVITPAVAVQLGDRLQKAGFFVSAVRPPTVPTSRLRFTVMATHQSVHIEQLTIALKTTLQNLLP
jgi:8-amino-7-oxononanoate synthase